MTAYRTRYTDIWSYKYYRYDDRGRVIIMWSTIEGLPMKEIRYKYNSQDQITEVNYGYESEFKRYSYYYDYAGRLGTLNFANSDPAIDKSAIDYNFTTYSYNTNSLISFQFFKASELQNQYEYSNRNWITSMNSLQGLFGFTNTYFPNGNVNTQLLFGTYKDYFPQNNYNLYYNFSYDNSNRLLNAVNSNQGDLSFSVLNTYDKDGNLTTLKRYGDNNIVTDDFNYQYYSGTNKLSKVTGTQDQYSYDLNGNVTRDTINYNFNIQYDHRNLITQFYHTDRAASSRPYTYATRYYYDESGSRVRKLEYFNTQTNPPLVTDWNNPGNGWTLFNNEFYVKSADGKDLATYQGSELEDWYVWGNDLTGKIRKDNAYYYYKDHLGSVRAVVNESAEIVAAYDYDAWGYPLEGRTYNADSMKFKYTGKELDKESLYDYFGARYYDARIGRWGQTDPVSDFEPSLNPYHYTNNNPLKYIDPKGLDYFFYLEGSSTPIWYPSEGENEYFYYHPMGNTEVEATGEYAYLNGLKFYKANSEITGSFYFKFNFYYSFKNVEFDFENSLGPKFVNYALNQDYNFLASHIIQQSLTGGIFDYKKDLSYGNLYLFDNMVYNKEEAGNILWGITMAHFNIPLDQTLAGANIYTLIKRLEFDEPNEQTAIMRGYLSHNKSRY